MPPEPRPPSLAEQLRRWQDAGLLSAEQVQGILAFETAVGETGETAVTATAAAPAHSRPGLSTAALLSLIGALVLGLGIVALVAANWGTLPRTLKFASLVLLTLTSYGAGYTLRDAPRAAWPGTGAALYLLGGMLFGAVLGFLSQGMQLGISINTLLALWGLGLLVLAYAVRLPPALHLALPLGGVIPLLGLFGGDWGWSVGAEYGETNLFIILLAGLFALAVAWWHDHRWPTPDPVLGHALGNPWAFWSAPLTLGGLLGVLGLLVDGLKNSSLSFSLISLGLTAGSLALFAWGQRQQRHAIENWSLIGLALGLYTLPLGGLLSALLAGAAALAVALWGGQQQEKRLVNLGLVGVGIAVLSIYFSVFARLLSISLVLVGAGLVLLGLGYGLERTRRRLNAAGDTGGNQNA